MTRTLPVHAVAIAVLVGCTLFIVQATRPGLPASTAQLLLALMAVVVAAWLGLLAFRFAHERAGRPARDWRGHDRAIVWMGNAFTIAGFWLTMPYADEALRLMVVIFLFGPATTEVLASIQRPPARRPWVLTPLMVPISTSLFYLVDWGPYSLPVILFSIAYAFVIIRLSRLIQRLVDRTYAARQAAEAALQEAAAARDAKTRFLASASHDLGQPLQAARLSFDQAMSSADPVQRDRAARRVRWAFDTTGQLLQQMLEHLRLESGAVEPRLERVAVGPLVARLAELHEPAARLTGVEIRTTPTRLHAVADPVLVERTLGNLVANAIRHAGAGRILVGARRNGGHVRLWVIDDGVGIAEADVPGLFEDYVQGGRADVRGGFGLGLASARRMATLMQGALGRDARWTKGSAFWLELPAA